MSNKKLQTIEAKITLEKNYVQDLTKKIEEYEAELTKISRSIPRMKKGSEKQIEAISKRDDIKETIAQRKGELKKAKDRLDYAVKKLNEEKKKVESEIKSIPLPEGPAKTQELVKAPETLKKEDLKKEIEDQRKIIYRIESIINKKKSEGAKKEVITELGYDLSDAKSDLLRLEREYAQITKSLGETPPSRRDFNVTNKIDEIRSQVRVETEPKLFVVKKKPLGKIIDSMKKGKMKMNILNTLVNLAQEEVLSDENENIRTKFVQNYHTAAGLEKSIASAENFNIVEIMDSIDILEKITGIKFEKDEIRKKLENRMIYLSELNGMDKLMKMYQNDPYTVGLYIAIGDNMTKKASLNRDLIKEIVNNEKYSVKAQIVSDEDGFEYNKYTYTAGNKIIANVYEFAGEIDDFMLEEFLARIPVSNGDVLSVSVLYSQFIDDGQTLSDSMYTINGTPILLYNYDGRENKLNINEIDSLKTDVYRILENSLSYENFGYSIRSITVYTIPAPVGGCLRFDKDIPRGLINVSTTNDNDCFFDCIKKLKPEIDIEKLRADIGLKKGKPVSIHMAKSICSLHDITISIHNPKKQSTSDITLWRDHYFLNGQGSKSIYVKQKEDLDEMMYVFFDIESRGEIVKNRKGDEERKQIPIVYGYKICITRKGKPIPDDDETHVKTSGYGTKFHFTVSFKKLLKDVCLFAAKTSYKGKILLVAFNGSKYDNILSLKDLFHKNEEVEGLTVKFGGVCIHNNSVIKAPMAVRLKGRKKPFNFDFLDLAKFMIGSLDSNLKSYKCKIMKGKFDTTTLNCPLEEMEDNNRRELLKYLEGDVMGLEELYHKKNMIFKELVGNELYHYVSTSNATYGVFRATENAKKIYRPDTVEDDEFIRGAIYGGNCKVFIRKFESKNLEDDYLVPLDCNALYPYAMTNNMPIGIPKKYDMKKISKALYKKIIDNVKSENWGCIMKAMITKAPKDIVYPWFPRKEIDGSTVFDFKENVETTIAGPQYVDMLRYGFEFDILEAMVWEKMEPVVKDYIVGLQEKRAIYKQKMAEALKEGDSNMVTYYDSLQNETKLMSNGLYGKFCQGSIFRKTKIISIGSNLREEIHDYVDKKQLGSLSFVGDYAVIETNIRSANACSKPSHIAAYLLAYSKRTMIGLFEQLGAMRDPNSLIYYCDTDSAYVHVSLANKIKQTSVLGGFKNDYGTNKKIIKAFFLAPKMKICRTMTNGTVDYPDKLTMKGVTQYKSDRKTPSMTMEDFEEIYNTGKGKIIGGQLKFTKTCINKREDKMFDICVNDDVKKNISIDHMTKKNKLINDRFYPLEYNYVN